MRLALGLFLVALALFGGYMVLTGKFPPSSINSGSTAAAAPSEGGVGFPTSTGSGGASVVGRITHLGIPVLPLVQGDHYASRGGYGQ